MLAQNEIKKNPAVQGTHILKSYLNALGIKYTEVTPTHLQITGKAGKTYGVVVGEGSAEVTLDPADISSYRLERSMKALHAVTEFGGFGAPQPVDRGERPTGRVNYSDNYEDVYLRHSIFRRSPNRTEDELAPYMKTIKLCARRAMFRWKNVFVGMGHAEEDLVNVGMVYTVSFLHNYASVADHTENIKLLTVFLHQRFGEMAKITFKKARSSTCLPQDVRSEHSVDGETSFIDTFAETEDAAPDEEYAEDTFRLTFKDGTVKMLTAKNNGMLGLTLFLDGRQLLKSESEALTAEIRSGAVAKQRVTVEEPEDTEESATTRKKKAEAELERRLTAMSPEQRRLTLAYAALARDYDVDARRAARKLAEELVCPKCLKKVPSGNVCLKCEVAAVPRYGVDYEEVRAELASEGNAMAEAMTASIPDSEQRSRAKRPQLAGPSISLAESAAVVPMKPTMSKDEIEAMADRMREECFSKLPDIVCCPKCKKDLPKERFGVRVARNKGTGIPETPSRQPYCKSCRKPKP